MKEGSKKRREKKRQGGRKEKNWKEEGREGWG